MPRCGSWFKVDDVANGQFQVYHTEGNRLPFGNQTWQWKIPYKWRTPWEINYHFHCHVWLSESNTFTDSPTCFFRTPKWSTCHTRFLPVQVWAVHVHWWNPHLLSILPLWLVNSSIVCRRCCVQPNFLPFFFRISTTKATVLLPLSSLSHAPHILGFHKSHLSWPWIARAPKGWTSRGTSEFSGFGRRLTLVCLKLRYSTEFNGLLSSSPLKCLYKTQCRYLLYIFSICWWCNILRFLLYQRTPLVQLSNCDMDWYGSIVCLLSWVMWDSINMSNCSIPSNLELCPNGTETSILRVLDWAIDFQCWFHGYPPWRPSKKGIFVTSFFNKWLFVRVS